MYVRNVPLETLREAAAAINAKLYNLREDRRGIGFVLRPLENCEFKRISPQTGRRVWAVCYHGHRAFMERVFAACPDASIHTSMARYNGADDFRDNHCFVAYRNVGSVMYPHSYGNACEC